MEGGFQISDNGQPKVDEKRFHSVSGKMKDDVKYAITRLLGKDGYFVFDTTKNGGITLIDGGKKNSREGYNRDLCLRIDLQDTHTEKINGRDIRFANVQIQLNIKDRPSTIAQVHFECGQDIPENLIRGAFDRSYTEKKIIYVYK